MAAAKKANAPKKASTAEKASTANNAGASATVDAHKSVAAVKKSTAAKRPGTAAKRAGTATNASAATTSSTAKSSTAAKKVGAAKKAKSMARRPRRDGVAEGAAPNAQTAPRMVDPHAPTQHGTDQSPSSEPAGPDGDTKIPGADGAKSPASAKNGPAFSTSSNESLSDGTDRRRSGRSTRTSKTSSVTATQDVPAFLSDTEWLNAQREELLSERLKYTHNAEMLAAEAASLMADREPGDVQFDEESGEGDTLAVERDRDLALSAQAREKVEEIDAALARLDEGTYGICVVGGPGDFIPQERLEALPMAAKCIQHQTSMF